MTNLTIHNLDESLANNLCKHAQQHGQTIEEEAWQILRLAFSEPSQKTGASAAEYPNALRKLAALNCRNLFAHCRVSQ